MAREVYLWGEMVFSVAICYMGLSGLFMFDHLQSHKNSFVVYQWTTGGGNYSPNMQDLEAN
jgi:hypothetical protein